MARSRALVRVLSELRHMQASHRGATLCELATAAGVSVRTIRRDLQALEAAGVPLFDARSTKKGSPPRWRVLEARRAAA
jgi:predicted DNA-binding transcriptional regulator YafY